MNQQNVRQESGTGGMSGVMEAPSENLDWQYSHILSTSSFSNFHLSRDTSRVLMAGRVPEAGLNIPRCDVMLIDCRLEAPTSILWSALTFGLNAATNVIDVILAGGYDAASSSSFSDMGHR